jgi:hypothetical protein
MSEIDKDLLFNFIQSVKDLVDRFGDIYDEYPTISGYYNGVYITCVLDEETQQILEELRDHLKRVEPLVEED